MCFACLTRENGENNIHFTCAQPPYVRCHGRRGGKRGLNKMKALNSERNERKGHSSGGKKRPFNVHPFSVPTELFLLCGLFICGWGGRENILKYLHRSISVAPKPSPMYICQCWSDSCVKIISCQALTGHQDPVSVASDT